MTLTAIATGYMGNMRCVAIASDGTIYVVIGAAAQTRIELWYSTDDGATWTENTTARYTPNSLTYCIYPSLYIDPNTDIAIVAMESNTGPSSYKTELARMDPISTSAAMTFLVETTSHTQGGQGNQNGEPMCFEDPDNSGHTMVLYQGFTYPGTPSATFRKYVYWRRYNASWVLQTSGSLLLQNLTGWTGATFAFQHDGDGVTPTSTPHIYVCYNKSSALMKFRRCDYASGAYSLGTERTWNAHSNNENQLSSMYDGDRFVALSVHSGDTTACWMVERDAGDTTTTERAVPDLAGSMAFAGVELIHIGDGDARVVAQQAASPKDVVYNDYDRSEDTWSGWTTLDEDADYQGGISTSRYVIDNFVPVVVGEASSSVEFTSMSFYSGSAMYLDDGTKKLVRDASAAGASIRLADATRLE